jgi:hypothetical protein
VPAHRDDPLGAQLPGGQDREQADGAVSDDGDGLARPGFGGNGTKPPGAEDVGCGEQIGDERVGRDLRGADKGAVGERRPGAGAGPLPRSRRRP